jgi:hypothetical protein
MQPYLVVVILPVFTLLVQNSMYQQARVPFAVCLGGGTVGSNGLRLEASKNFAFYLCAGRNAPLSSQTAGKHNGAQLNGTSVKRTSLATGATANHLG